MKLEHLRGNTWCIHARSLFALYDLGGGDCVLLDTGHRKERAELEDILREKGLRPVSSLCTHMHHDHYGNARYLKDAYGAEIILPLGEAADCAGPAALCAAVGFFSPVSVTKTALMETIGPVDRIIAPEQTALAVGGADFRVIHARGHSRDQCAYVTPDGVLVAGDGIFCGEELAKTRFPYTCAFGDDVASKAALAESGCDLCVVGHRGVLRSAAEIRETAERNIAALERCLDLTRECLDREMTMDELCAALCKANKMQTGNALKAILIRRSVQALAERLIDLGEAEAVARLGVMAFRPVKADGETA